MINQQIEEIQTTILADENLDTLPLSEYITQDAINLLSMFGFEDFEIINIINLVSSFKYQQCIEKVVDMHLKITRRTSKYVPIESNFITIQNAYSFDKDLRRGQCMDMSYVLADLLNPLVEKINNEGILGIYKLGIRIRNGRSSLFFFEEGSNHVWLELYLSRNNGFIELPNHLILDPAFRFIRSSLPKNERINYEELTAHLGSDKIKLTGLEPSLEVGNLIIDGSEPTFDLKDKHFIGLTCDGSCALSISFLHNVNNQVIPIVRLKDLGSRSYYFFLNNQVDIDLSIIEFGEFVKSFKAQGYPDLTYPAQKEAKEILFILNKKLLNL